MLSHRVSYFLPLAGLALLTSLGVLTTYTPTVHAATERRFTVDDNGNFLIFGNTVGFDCHDGVVVDPVVGFVPRHLLGGYNCNGLLGNDIDSSIDIYWRSESPQANQAQASLTWDPSQARSTAMLVLPANARVLHARLYWAAQRSQGQGAGTSVTFERPGVFKSTLQQEVAATHVTPANGLDYYQSSADVTRELQSNGSGIYRVSGIQTFDVRNKDIDVAYMVWNVVVFYHLDGEPSRNLSLFDGLDRVSPGSGSSTTVDLNGFTVPTGTLQPKTGILGVIAYEGDENISGDSLAIVGSSALENTNNPFNNFFNRTFTIFDQRAPRPGDLPQMTGGPKSMAGYDADVLDITSSLTAGKKSLQVMASTTNDEYFLGVLATAVQTVRPVFSSTTKSVRNITHTDGRFLPGDTLEYTISTKNTGNDVGTKVVVTDKLPSKVTYTPGSLKLVTGPGAPATLSDGADSDVGEVVSGTVTMRLGTGANGTTGGNLGVNESASFQFLVTINANAQGTIDNQAVLTSTGQVAGSDPSPGGTWNSGNGTNPNAPTTIVISTCQSNADCSQTAPICDLSLIPPQCVCKTNSDCPVGLVCNSAGNMQCVECIPPNNSTCDPNGAGGVCQSNNQCGCNNNNDCSGGRNCNTTTHICDPIDTDLSLTFTRSPVGGILEPGTPITYTLTATNNGQVAVNNANLSAVLNPNLAGAMWTCTSNGTAICPALSGTLPLDSLVNLPAGGKLVYTYTVTTENNPSSSSLDFSASLTPPRGFRDTNPSDNTVADSIIVGMLPLGPDLVIAVSEKPSDTDSSVAYTVQVTNLGPGEADGATVTYNVPDGADITLMPGDGWQCDRPNNGTQVVCTRTKPIPEGTASPIVIVAKGQLGQTELPLKISVMATDEAGGPLADPHPADNTIDRTTTLHSFKYAGGGFGGCNCSLTPDSTRQPAGTAAVLLVAVLGVALGLRRVYRLRRIHS